MISNAVSGRRGRRPVCTWKYLVGGKPGGGADGVAMGALSTCGSCISQSFCSSSPTMVSMRAIIDTLDTAVGAGMVGACGNFVDAEGRSWRARESSEQNRTPFFGKKGSRTSA